MDDHVPSNQPRTQQREERHRKNRRDDERRQRVPEPSFFSGRRQRNAGSAGAADVTGSVNDLCGREGDDCYKCGLGFSPSQSQHTQHSDRKREQDHPDRRERVPMLSARPDPARDRDLDHVDDPDPLRR